jgi:phage terminase large subunit
LPYNPDEIISINPDIKDLSRLIAQLSQATATQNSVGKLVVDKLGEGEKSPDGADACVIAYAPRVLGVVVKREHLSDADDGPPNPYWHHQQLGRL